MLEKRSYSDGDAQHACENMEFTEIESNDDFKKDDSVMDWGTSGTPTGFDTLTENGSSTLTVESSHEGHTYPIKYTEVGGDGCVLELNKSDVEDIIISFWTYHALDAVTSGHLWQFRLENGGTRVVQDYLDENGEFITYHGPSSSSTKFTITTGGWHHLTFVIDNTQDSHDVYVDGILRHSGSYRNSASHIDKIYLGFTTDTSYIDGLISDAGSLKVAFANLADGLALLNGLVTEKAYIDDLKAGSITINEDLDASEHSIVNLKAASADGEALRYEQSHEENENIGSSNKGWKPLVCQPYDEHTNTSSGKYRFYTGSNLYLMCTSILPLTKKDIDGNTVYLHCDKIRFYIYDADASNYIEGVKFYGYECSDGSPSSSKVIDNFTGWDSEGRVELSFSSTLSAEDYECFGGYLRAECGTLGNLEILGVEMEVWWE